MEGRRFAFISLIMSMAFSRSIMHLSLPRGTPKLPSPCRYRISQASITSLLLAMRGLPPLFGFFFYIGDDRVRHESLELRAVLGYLPHY